MARKTEPFGLCPAMILLLMLCGQTVRAQQEDVEYKMEVGGGAGATFYLGDANSTPYAHMGVMGGAVVRRIFNPRMCVKGNLAMGHISGTSEGRYIPQDPLSQTPEGGVPTTVAFSRNLIDVGAQFEMNFWGYGRGGGYKENSPITPYALAGMGLTLAMGPRWNVGLEWTMRFTTSDELDVSRAQQRQLFQPYGIKSVGLKNKDCYSFTMLYVTYDICPKYRKCNN